MSNAVTRPRRGSDAEYWNAFYASGVAPQECSTFAQSVVDLIPKDGFLFELGCGNGRDAFFFAKHGIPVYATDLSEVSIADLNGKVDSSKNPRFIAGDFTRLPTPFEDTTMATVYSRFTLHAVKKEEASRALAWAYNNLRNGGRLLIEVRSVLDPLCGQGEPVEGEEDAWLTSHYRRFVRREQLVSELESLGFVLDTVIEADNLAVYKDDNPVVIRIHAHKAAAASV